MEISLTSLLHGEGGDPVVAGRCDVATITAPHDADVPRERRFTAADTRGKGGFVCRRRRFQGASWAVFRVRCHRILGNLARAENDGHDNEKNHWNLR
jgi:hypothetical protein